MSESRPPRLKVGSLIGRSNLGRMLALYRTANGWTLRDLAPLIGISTPTLLRVEQGKATDVETFLKLWRWLLERTDR